MALSRTFVGFANTDMMYYRLMLSWKENENLDLNFTNRQLADEINSADDNYVRPKCSARIDIVSTFALVIGQFTKSRHKYVRWKVEVAIEKECRQIGINIEGSRRVVDATVPPVMRNVGAVFVPFSPNIVAYALENHVRNPNDDYFYMDPTYNSLGY